MNARAASLLSVVLLAACVDAPEDRLPIGPFDESAGRIEVAVLGDGFVLADGRRLPLEALVLELRRATRRMTPDQRSRFVVYLWVSDTVQGDAAAQLAERGLNRLLDEFDVMEISQVKLSSTPSDRSAATAPR